MTLEGYLCVVVLLIFGCSVEALSTDVFLLTQLRESLIYSVVRGPIRFFSAFGQLCLSLSRCDAGTRHRGALFIILFWRAAFAFFHLIFI